MKTGFKKHTATAENFNELQALRSVIKKHFYVSNVKWGGNWNGMNWENFSFFCMPETLHLIKDFCKKHELSIEFSF